MFDFSHLLPLGMLQGTEPKKPSPVRTPTELAESLLRWRCSEYAPGIQCHLCDDCKLGSLCGLCTDLKEAAALLLKMDNLNPSGIVLRNNKCLHGVEGGCDICTEDAIPPVTLPKGAQD